VYLLYRPDIDEYKTIHHEDADLFYEIVQDNLFDKEDENGVITKYPNKIELITDKSKIKKVLEDKYSSKSRGEEYTPGLPSASVINSLFPLNIDYKDRSSKFYYSRAWKNLSAMVKARANGCDEYILYTEHRIIPGVLSHHIEPSDKCPDLKFRADNLIYVSAKTHRMIHDEYSKSEQSKLNMQHKLIEIRNNRQ
jgi:hypothetical protein